MILDSNEFGFVSHRSLFFMCEYFIIHTIISQKNELSTVEDE